MGSKASEPPDRPVGSIPYALFRVDDRLLHGQVALGWAPVLRAECFLLADARLAADPLAAELYGAAAPEGSRVIVLDPAMLARGLGEKHDPRRTVLLVRGLSEAALLLRAGIPGPLNLGGLHLHAGAHAVFPYLYLSPEDEGLLRRLLVEGFEIFAQDLPRSSREDAGRWLALT